VIENFVFLELLKNNENAEIKFYKKKNGTEIDFILENWNGKIIPIEVKSSNSLAIPKIFYSFEKDY
jgi:predicted AAA+ superfamily ATPase